MGKNTIGLFTREKAFKDIKAKGNRTETLDCRQIGRCFGLMLAISAPRGEIFWVCFLSFGFFTPARAVIFLRTNRNTPGLYSVSGLHRACKRI